MRPCVSCRAPSRVKNWSFIIGGWGVIPGITRKAGGNGTEAYGERKPTGNGSVRATERTEVRFQHGATESRRNNGETLGSGGRRAARSAADGRNGPGTRDAVEVAVHLVFPDRFVRPPGRLRRPARRPRSP